MFSIEDAKEEWNKPLTNPQKHITLFSKNHYKNPNDLSTKEVIQAIYAKNKGGVICRENKYLLRFLDKTLLRLIGPMYIIRMREMVADIQNQMSVLRPDNLWDGYMSEIRMARVSFDDVPDWIDRDRLPFLDVDPEEIVIEDERMEKTYRLIPRNKK